MRYEILKKPVSGLIIMGVLVFTLGGCSDAFQRRADVPQPSGANESIDDRFALTADAQDPSERDKDLGYGRWKSKPETDGTADPRSPTRRGKSWAP